MKIEAIRLLLEIQDDAFLNEIYKVLRFHAGEGETLSRGDWCKGRIFSMLETIDSEQDERFLNQIRTIVRLHIERKGGAV